MIIYATPGILNKSAFPELTLMTKCSLDPQPNLNSAYTLRYNDSMVHSIPVGINAFSSAFHMTALANQGKDPRPVHTKLQLLPSLSPKWTYDSTIFTSTLLIGMAFVAMPGGFAIEVVAVRQVRPFEMSLPPIEGWSVTHQYANVFLSSLKTTSNNVHSSFENVCICWLYWM